MGGEPKLAQNILCVPADMPGETVREILRGGYDKVFEAGALITGGHSIFDEEPKYGLAVTGFVHPDRLLANSTAKPGDVLFLTKALGVGIAMTAIKGDELDNETTQRCYEQMIALNKAARDIVVQYRVHACTDVTGFSLMGHALEMAQGSDVTLKIETSRVPMLPHVVDLAKDGWIPAAAYRNRQFTEPYVNPGETPTAVCDVLLDPQTSGGLLVAVHPADADKLERELAQKIPGSRRIGTVVATVADDQRLILLP